MKTITFGPPLPLLDFGAESTNQQGETKMTKLDELTMRFDSISKRHHVFSGDGALLGVMDKGSLRRAMREQEDQDKGVNLTERHEAIKKCLGLSDPELIAGVAEVMERTGADLIEGLREYTASPEGAKLWEQHQARVAGSGRVND
jgi:hypothetical protein